MDWGWMDPGPPWPPAGTAKAIGGGSSVAKSINGLPGVAGTPASSGTRPNSILCSMQFPDALLHNG